MALLTRRAALLGGLSAGGLGLGACARVTGADALTGEAAAQRVLALAEGWSRGAHRLLQRNGHALAREFSPADISPVFKANGTLRPAGETYARAVETGFADWRLRIDGLVTRPLSLSLATLRALPARTQITRHDCVEGWSAIGGWTGVPLSTLLAAAGVLPAARYAVFHCADNLDGRPETDGRAGPGQYYESLDLTDALHPQTIVAYAMNGAPLAVPHGAPLRLRVERQLGYKHAKYLQRITLAASFAAIAGGKGGYWEDRGYEWYAGI